MSPLNWTVSDKPRSEVIILTKFALVCNIMCNDCHKCDSVGWRPCIKRYWDHPRKFLTWDLVTQSQKSNKEQTANLARMFSSTTNPIAIIRERTPFHSGIFNVGRPEWWVYIKRAWSSGCSTSSNSWSQTMIHSANSFLNLAWSHWS